LPALPKTQDFASAELQLVSEEKLTATECRAKLTQLSEMGLPVPVVGKWGASSEDSQTFVNVGCYWPHPPAMSVQVAYVRNEANEMWYLNGGTLGPTDADLHLAKNGQIYTASQLKGFFLGDGHCMTMQKKKRPSACA